MGYKVYYSDADKTSAAGFGMVGRLPSIFDNRPGYHRMGSRYLIELGLGHWPRKQRELATQTILPTDQSMKNAAEWLANFLEWAEVNELDFTTCAYIGDVIGGYQSQMLTGEWSLKGKGLSPGTINCRVDQACDYLQWMASKGHRPAFEIPTKTVQVVSRDKSGFQSKSLRWTEVREGKVTENPKHVTIPTDDQIKHWLSHVYNNSGYTKGLMAETILLTAIRREEAVCLRHDFLPEDRRSWDIKAPTVPNSAQEVQVRIVFGAKGHGYGYDHGDKIGPRRDIWFPLEHAERLHEYRMKYRPAGLRKWVKSAHSKAEQKRRIEDTLHLFLDEETGHRITGKELYRAWKGAPLPFSSWCPRGGRHYWACTTLWNAMLPLLRSLTKRETIQYTHLESSAIDIIQLRIQPQLGHADHRTTMTYLRWYMNMISNPLTITGVQRSSRKSEKVNAN